MQSWYDLPWDNLKTFYRLAQAESFTRGGEKMNLSQSAVSRQIILLEEHLDLQLFTRQKTGPTTLTPEGETLYCAVEKMTHTLSHSLSEFEEQRQAPKGLLRISFPSSFFTFCFLPSLSRFLNQYPDIKLKLYFHETTSWPDTTDIDLVITPLKLPQDSQLIQKPLLSFQFQLYGSPNYFLKFDKIDIVEELGFHRLIGYTGRFKDILAPLNWALNIGLSHPYQRDPYLEVESLEEAFLFAQHGCGLASLPYGFLSDLCPLIPVLPYITKPTMEFYLTYEKHLESFKRVEIFADWIQLLNPGRRR